MDILVVPHAWATKPSCLVYVDGMMLVNKYKIEVGFDTSAANPILHDVAFEKIEMFFDILMNNSIIISKEDFKEKTFKLENNYIELYDILNDQALGSAIFSKLMALVGEDMVINYVKISSNLGKGIRYHIDNDSPELNVLLPNKDDWWENEDIKNQPWFMRPDSATYDEVLTADSIYTGEFDWNDHFSENLEQAKSLDVKKTKFEIIRGGKDETEPSK